MEALQTRRLPVVTDTTFFISRNYVFNSRSLKLVFDDPLDASDLIFLLLQSKELVKAYPPFVNFFEMSKETIVRCEKQKPRFHAFLKVGHLPDFHKQT